MPLTEIVFTPRSMRLTSPESTLPGPTSTNVVAPLLIELRRGLGEPHRRRQLVDEECGELLRRLHLRRHGRHERRQGLREPHSIERRPQPVGGAGDERTVERARDLEPDCSSSAEAFRLGAALLYGVELAGDDDLPGAVVVRRPHPDDPPAELLDLLVRETEDRCHGSGPLAGGLGHRQTTLAHERRSPRRSRASPQPRAPRTRRPSARRRRRGPVPARASRRGSRGSSRRARAAGPRCPRAPRAACRSRGARGPGPKPRSRAGRPRGPPETPRRCPGPSPSRGTPGRGSRMRPCSSGPPVRPFDEGRAPGEAGSHPGHENQRSVVQPPLDPRVRRAREGSSRTRCCHSDRRSRRSSPGGSRAYRPRSRLSACSPGAGCTRRRLRRSCRTRPGPARRSTP